MSTIGRGTFDPRALRSAFGAFMTGVTIVAAHDREGRPIGFTANSFASVSLDPPLLLVCLARSSRNFENLTNADRFAVNVLAEHQTELSNTFARPVEDRFAQVDWRKGPYGSPVFGGVAAWFDCSMHRIVEGGDHVILIGRVEAFENGTANGLGYARGGYITPASSEAILAATAKDADLLVSAVIERLGTVLLIEDARGQFTLPSSPTTTETPVRDLGRQLGLDLDAGYIYSVYTDRRSGRQHIIYRCSSASGTPRTGRFIALDALPDGKLADKAHADLLRRFAQENSLGNFGLYLGNETSGRVLSLARKG